jgi:hypothetical protein
MSLDDLPAGTGLQKTRRPHVMRNDMRDWYLIASVALLTAAAMWLLVWFGS